MTETTTLYAHQISPGNDELLGFEETLDACKVAAKEMVDDINLHEPEELAPIAVYRCKIKLPDRQTLVSVLNEKLSLLEACVVEKQLVTTIET